MITHCLRPPSSSQTPPHSATTSHSGLFRSWLHQWSRLEPSWPVYKLWRCSEGRRVLILLGVLNLSKLAIVIGQGYTEKPTEKISLPSQIRSHPRLLGEGCSILWFRGTTIITQGKESQLPGHTVRWFGCYGPGTVMTQGDFSCSDPRGAILVLSITPGV